MLTPILRTSTSFPFLHRDREAECKRALAARHPCGLVDAPGGHKAFWMGFPTGNREILVVAGFRDADGIGQGVRFNTTSPASALPDEVRSMLAAPPVTDEAHGGTFVDVVLSAMALDVAATELAIIAKHPKLQMTMGLRHRLAFERSDATQLVACRLGIDAGLVDVRAASVSRAGRWHPVGTHGYGSRNVLAAASTLELFVRQAAAPFLASVEGPALALARSELSGPNHGAVLTRMSDVTWAEIDEATDRTGIRGAISAHRQHADLLVSHRAKAGRHGRSDMLAAAASGTLVRPVARRVTAAFLESGAWCILAGRGREASLDILRPDMPWSAPTGSDRFGGWGAVTSHATAALGFLGLLPPEWCPSSLAEWKAFDRLAPVLMSVAAHAYGRGTHAAPWGALLNVGGEWQAFEARLRNAAGGLDLMTAVRNLQDVETAYVDQVIAPALEMTRPPGRCIHVETGTAALHARVTAARALWSGRSLPRMLEVSLAWHSRREAMATDIERLDGGSVTAVAWDGGFPDMIVGEVEVRCLASAAELREEGAKGVNPDGSAGLAHCVGGYSGRCLSGQSRVLSLRRKGRRPFERLSTAEVGLKPTRRLRHRGTGPFPNAEPNLPSWHVRQHYGHGNASPTPECVAALASYLAALATGEAKVSRVRKVSSPKVPTVVAAAGYDFRVPGTFQGVRDLWSPLLPGPRRGWDPARYRAEALKAAGDAKAFH